MRTTARISLCALALLAAGIAGCRDDDRLSYEKDAQEGDIPPIGVQSISVLKSLYHDRLYRTCHLFDFVMINCQGLALGSEGGTLLLGTFPTGDYCVDRIPAADVARYLAVTPAATRRQSVVRTDRRCDYARKPLPAGEGTLCGIVEYFNGRYRLRVTNHEILFDRQ